MASRMILRSNFRACIPAAKDGLGDAVDKWQETGEDEARNALTKKEAQRGYSLDTLYDSIKGEKDGDLQAHYGTDVFYARFFEYGSYGGAGIEPMPFIRPAKTKADKAFKAEAGTSVERAIRRRAGM